MSTATKPAMTGIKNADEFLTLARAYGLTVTVDSSTGEQTAHVIRVSIPVPAVHVGTDLGHSIESRSLNMVWVLPRTRGARGRLEVATFATGGSSRIVRSLRGVRDDIEQLGEDSNRYHREAAPMPEDVVDAPHALYIDGKLRAERLSASFVRTVVKVRRFKGHSVHQDATGAICIENRRYAPQPAPTDERQHVRTVNGGTPQLIPSSDARAEINTAMMEGKRDVREMSACRSTARITYRDGRTVDLRPVHEGDTPAVQEQRPTVQELTGPIDDDLLAYFAETYAAVDEGTAIPVRADMVRPGMDVIATVRLEDRTVGTVHAFNGSTPWVSVTWTNRTHADSVMGDGRVFEPGHHLIVTVDSLERLYGPAAPTATVAAERPAAAVLAADPIPAGSSVLEGMPGREITREELRTAGDVLAHDGYVVQLRDSGAWILPNHDDQADMTRGHVATALRLAFHRSQGSARATLDTDGTVYVSNGYRAARYIPAALIADYSADVCPGCATPYATNGDGPCSGGRSVPARQARTENAQESAVPGSFHTAREPRAQVLELAQV